MLVGGIAQGQSDYDLHAKWCQAPKASELTITGCSTIIAEDRETPRIRAISFRNRGLGYQARGDFDRAIADFDEALRIQPDYFDAAINKGTAYYEQHEMEQALEAFEDAFRISPRNAVAAYNR